MIIRAFKEIPLNTKLEGIINLLDKNQNHILIKISQIVKYSLFTWNSTNALLHIFLQNQF